MACIIEGSTFYLGNTLHLRPHILTSPGFFTSKHCSNEYKLEKYMGWSSLVLLNLVMHMAYHHSN